MKTRKSIKSKKIEFGTFSFILAACIILCFVNLKAQVPSYNVSASSGTISIAVPNNSLTGASRNLTLSGAGTAIIDASSIISATVSVTTNSNSDLDMYLVGPANCGTLELSTDNGSSGHNYASAVIVTPSSASNINTLTGAVNNISGIWKAEGSYDQIFSQPILFDFNNAPIYTSLPITLTEGGITANFTATGGGYSIQNVNVLGFTPLGFTGRCIYPNSIFLSDLIISFDQTLSDFSIMYSCQELGCDDAATMRVTAKMNGTVVGTNTKTAANPGTWPVDVLSCSFPQGFNSVVVHYDSHPPTCQDYGVIFMAEDMKVTPINSPSPLASGTGGGSYTLPAIAINGCPVNGTWKLFVGDDAAGSSSTITSVALNITNSISAALSLKVFLEGYYLGSGIMNSSLTGHPAISDTITVELHSAYWPYDLQYSSKGVINTNGNGNFTFPSMISDQYYIVVKHRNSIETWSASPVNFNMSSVNYDFTASQFQAYGNNMIETYDQMGWAVFSGDISDGILGVGFQDGIIESQDYSDMENAVSAVLQGYVSEDITGDGIVESADYSLMENNVYFIISSMRP